MIRIRISKNDKGTTVVREMLNSGLPIVSIPADEKALKQYAVLSIKQILGLFNTSKSPKTKITIKLSTPKNPRK